MPKAKVSVVVLGTGSMGHAHLRNLATIREAEIVGVADISAKSAKKTGQEYGVPWATDVDQIIKKTKPIAATIASPHPTHLEIARKCFRRGLHVFTDKPMTAVVSEADKMIVAARKARRILAVMFQFRNAIATRRAKELIDRGDLGKIQRVDMTMVCPRTAAYFTTRSWRGTWANEGGGILMNQAPHMLDWMIYLTGMPSRVIGRCATVRHRIETEDWADALLEYPGGATGYLMATTAEAPALSRLEVAGDKGRLVIEDFKSMRFGKVKGGFGKFIRTCKKEWAPFPTEWKKISLKPRRGEFFGHGANLRDFILAVKRGRKPMITGEDARQSLELANALTLSAFNGAPVDLPVGRREYDRLYDFLCKRGKGKRVQKMIPVWRRSRSRKSR